MWLENEFIRVMIPPELGGRIHAGKDKTDGYDFFYTHNVIKPALVRLAGPWVSGGVEFNWPQHHRPATFMPVDVEIERHPDGAVTGWCGDHDPLARMKAMRGVCVYPDKSYIELKVRAYNRAHSVQTFLWWADVATRVHEDHQSFSARCHPRRRPRAALHQRVSALPGSLLRPGLRRARPKKNGPADHTNIEASVSLRVKNRQARAGVCVSTRFPGATITLSDKGKTLVSGTRDLAPGASWVEDIALPKNTTATDLRPRVLSNEGRDIIAYQPKPAARGVVPPPATEPPPPEQIASADELYVTGLHLDQYRHATRSPVPY